MAYLRPDVYVNETLSTGVAAGGPVNPSGAFIGISWKGPTTPTLITSWSDYVTKFGGFPSGTQAFSWLPYAVFAYFSNGGGNCYVCRVLHADSATSAVQLDDRAGSPADTLLVKAYSPGSWGNSLHVKVIDRDQPNGRFDLQVMLDGTADSNIVERFTDVTMDSTSDRYIVPVVNSDTRGSVYIRVTDSSSATAAPNDTPATGTFDLASGSNGSAPDDNDITGPSGAMQKFDIIKQPLIMVLPGQSSSAVLGAAISYAEGRRDVFVVGDTPQNLDAASAISYANTLAGSTGSSFGAVYYPWVKTIDPSVNRSGVLRTMPPSGAVAGLYMKNDSERGPHKVPAGLSTKVAGAVDLENQLTNTDLDSLNAANVNALRVIGSSPGVAVMGGRTLKRTSPDMYISVRRSLIYLRDSLTRLTEFAVFEPNDPVLWATISQRCNKFLNGFYLRGGLRGTSAKEAFFVKCDSDNNTLASIEAGEVHVEVGVALQYPAEFVIIQIGQWEGGSSATEVF